MKIVERLLILLALSTPVCLSMPQDVEQIPNAAWRQQFGDDAFDHRYQRAEAQSNGLVVGVGRRSAANSGEPWASWLWFVNRKGELERTVEIKGTDRLPGDAEGTEIGGLAMLEGGSIMASLQSGKAPPILNLVGKSAVSLPVANPVLGEQTVISKIFQTTDRNVLLVGSRIGKAIFIKVTPDGEKLWEQTLPGGTASAILGGLATEDGGAVLVADFWSGDPFFQGQSTVWVGKIDATGKVRSEQKFTGRRPRLAKTEAGYLVVLDRSSSVSQDIRVQALTDTLDISWSSPVLSTDRGVATFRIVPAGNGSLVVGSHNLKLWASRLDAAGKPIWRYSDPQIQSSDFDLTSVGNRAYVVYPLISTFMVGSKRRLNNKVGVIALDLN